VVIAAAIGLIEIHRPAPHLPHPAAGSSGSPSSAPSAWQWLGAIPGIGLAILVAVIEFLWDGWRPLLGGAWPRRWVSRATTTSCAIPKPGCIPGLVLFRWDAPLFFANAELFHATACWRRWQ
jgi:hypothetical protein